MRFLLIITLLLITFSAQGYQGVTRIGLYKDSSLLTSKITHIIVIGSAVKEDSNQFFQSGIIRAEKYKQLWPEHQVVIMSSPEVRGTSDEKVFAEFNIPVVQIINNSFTPEVLISLLTNYTKIASLDFYGHSSPWALKLGKSDAALVPDAYEKKLRALKENFLPSAYVTLNGCNSGFSIAPDLSKYLEIPVSGSLTGTLFERIESDNKWYKEADWTPTNYVTINPATFGEDAACSLGLCWRMKPSQHSYGSYWGSFKEGLNFYKFFCNFENTNGRCEKAMALSLLSFPSVKSINEDSSLENFKEVAMDYICSTYKSKIKFENCVTGINNAITKGDLVYQSHPGPELDCDFKTCKATVVCQSKRFFGSGPKGGTCRLNAEIKPNPTNAAQEMVSFLKGFKLLKKK